MPKSYFVAYPKKLNNLYITITKQLNLKLFLTILISMVSVNAFSYDALIDGIYYNFDGDNAIVVENPSVYQGSVVIPSSVNYNSKDYSVTSIGDNAFYGCSGLTSVTIGNSVTSIGDFAFYDCSGLTSIVIPNSVTSIGELAFNGCSGLTSITIPNSVTSIGESAFSGCSGQTSVTINSNSIVSADHSTYYSMTRYFGDQIKEYIIGEGVTRIGDYTFFGCSWWKCFPWLFWPHLHHHPQQRDNYRLGGFSILFWPYLRHHP